MLLRFCTDVETVCHKGDSSFLYTNDNSRIFILYSSSGAHQSSLSNASAASFSACAMPTIVLSRQEDDENDRLVAPPRWVSRFTFVSIHGNKITMQLCTYLVAFIFLQIFTLA